MIKRCRQIVWFLLGITCAVSAIWPQSHVAAFQGFPQDRGTLTPIQLEIEKQRMRLSSAEGEERRDAVTRLGSMRHPEASRAALFGLKDRMAIVRATSATAVLSLPVEESAASLTPLLTDKDEFVRREVAYALGQTRSHAAVPGLVERLLTDKSDEVRGAAAVALGQVSSVGTVSSLASVLNPQSGVAASKKNKNPKREQNPFVLRSAARSLGQIGDRAGVPALIVVLGDEKAESDVRRESAFALGEIGDPAALPILRAALTASDPHLVETASDAIRKIQRSSQQ
jgi:HEAT repeat protein